MSLRAPRVVVLGGKARSVPVSTPDGGTVPAEHGFRFFPGFSRNLRETMERIPLPEGGVVVDNLVHTDETLIAATEGQETVSETRTRPGVVMGVRRRQAADATVLRRSGRRVQSMAGPPDAGGVVNRAVETPGVRRAGNDRRRRGRR